VAVKIRQVLAPLTQVKVAVDTAEQMLGGNDLLKVEGVELFLLTA
jgi:hypothetical protein